MTRRMPRGYRPAPRADFGVPLASLTTQVTPFSRRPRPRPRAAAGLGASMLRTRNRRRFLFDYLESRLAMTGLYVSPLGDDSAAGTIDAPWRTIPHAVAAANPGDVI